MLENTYTKVFQKKWNIKYVTNMLTDKKIMFISYLLVNISRTFVTSRDRRFRLTSDVLILLRKERDTVVFVFISFMWNTFMEHVWVAFCLECTTHPSS